MNTSQAIAAIVGLLMPIIITIVKQAGFSRTANFAIAVASCVIAGGLTAWATGKLTPANIVGDIAIVLTASQAIYASFWKDSGVESKLNDLTSVKKDSELTP